VPLFAYARCQSRQPLQSVFPGQLLLSGLRSFAVRRPPPAVGGGRERPSARRAAPPSSCRPSSEAPRTRSATRRCSARHPAMAGCAGVPRPAAGTRPFKLVADRPELALQPEHGLGWQRGPIGLRIGGLQQRPYAEQPIWLFYPAGGAIAGRLADDDDEPPRRRGNLIACVAPACGLWLLHATRLLAGGGSSQGPFVLRRYHKVPSRRAIAAHGVGWHVTWRHGVEPPRVRCRLRTELSALCPTVRPIWSVRLRARRKSRAVRQEDPAGAQDHSRTVEANAAS